jgi:uncharacterized protein (DUF2235 family)
MQNIVLLSDGTGNTATKGRGTNVWKLYEALDTHEHQHDPGKVKQLAYYDDGVGTEQNKLLRLLGGALGWGLSRNVRQLYTALCRSYEPGDRIYLFGFSRGAYTVRTLAGMIVSCGILRRDRWKDDAELHDLVKQAYRCFRLQFSTVQGKYLSRFRARAPRWMRALGGREAEDVLADFRKKHSIVHEQHAPNGRPWIRFMGVWDTVDAVGLPVDLLADALNAFVWPFKFPDFVLCQQVQKACHALAIDDERRTFHPVMWNEENEIKPEEGTEPRIEQVWFAGVHSNVGGGYPKQGMSLVSLNWMMAKAEQQGLRFEKNVSDDYHRAQNVLDKLYNSRSGLKVYYRYAPRDIAKICRENHVVPKIHLSTLDRIALGTLGYAPGNLPASFEVLPTHTRVQVPGEDPATLSGLVGKIIGTGSEEKPLLLQRKGVRGTVRARQYLHALFLAATIAIALLPLYAPPLVYGLPGWVEKWLGRICSLVPFETYAYNLIVGYPYVLLAPLVFFFAGLALRLRCQKEFTAYWRSVMPWPWR